MAAFADSNSTGALPKIDIPPDPKFGDRTALVAVGSLSDVHDAVLAATTPLPPNAELDSKPAFAIPAANPNPIAPAKDWYDQRRALGRLPTIEDFVTMKQKQNHHTHLYQVEAGAWKACKLENPKIITSSNKMCGAVLWHTDSIMSSSRNGTTCNISKHEELDSVARFVRERICVQGAAGQYNSREEPKAFLELGGRIVGRDAWECGSEGVCNRRLPESHPRKFRYATIEEQIQEVGFGPDCAFASVSSYWNTGWPVLERRGYGVRKEVVQDRDPPDEPHLERYGDLFHAHFLHQEYLAARIVTRKKHHSGRDTGKADQKRPGTSAVAVVQCIVLFTYSSPEQLGDVFLEGGIPISGEAKSILSPEAFWGYVSQGTTSESDLRNVLSLLGASKLLLLLQEGVPAIMENENHKDIVALHKLMKVLYGSHCASQARICSPSLLCLHNDFLVGSQSPAVVDTVVACLEEHQLLHQMLARVAFHFEDGNRDWAPSSGSLLLTVGTIQCAQYLLDAGAMMDEHILEDREASDRRLAKKSNSEEDPHCFQVLEFLKAVILAKTRVSKKPKIKDTT